MVCTQCGSQHAPGAQFCPQCGATVAQTAPPQGWTPAQAQAFYAVPTLEQRMRVGQNLQPLGVMWLLFGAYRIVSALVAALTLHAMSRSGFFSFGDAPAFLPHLFGSLIPAIVITASFMAILALITGYALLTRQPWARTLAIVMGILSLIKLPLGTALGIYTLWVMAPSASGVEWQQLQQPQTAARN